MTFSKNYNVTLTQMAQWIDANTNNPERDDNKFVEYLYHLVFNKAQKIGLFNDLETTDDFALFCISKFLIRFSNKDESPVKSVVNYLNTVIEHWRAEYVRDFCSGSAEMTIADFNVSDFSDYLVDVASENDYNRYSFHCFKVKDIFKQHLIKIPKKKHSPEWYNIYISCLLTLQDRIRTASDVCKKLALEDPVLVNRVVRGLKTKPPILFHVEEDLSAYISVLVNELIHTLASELTHTIHSKVSTTSCLRNLVKAASNDEDED